MKSLSSAEALLPKEMDLGIDDLPEMRRMVDDLAIALEARRKVGQISLVLKRVPPDEPLKINETLPAEMAERLAGRIVASRYAISIFSSSIRAPNSVFIRFAGL